ncbi:MAG: M14/M99 family metallopeptidase [Desulfobacterales bacterium]|nr:M14/M99 family metallopeptidase [Desulfobacterales bacterium]
MIHFKLIRFKHIQNKIIFAGICFFFLLHSAIAGQRSHIVFFEGEENELHVYRIKGSEPGKTLLIVGGIQGDEPGGFLAADFYADFMLEKGNLIVVPRANFPSILKRERKINQDMNRKFLDDDIPNYESRVVDVLKTLICESDCFLNLHEGSGIYYPVWVNDQKNPKRFGQSIIADDSVLEDARAGGSIDLEAMAGRVIEQINKNIKNKEHLFNFNNHKTSDPDSIHKEQLKSATYYAHNTCKIPAFGIESAKFLSLETKVRQHIYAINGFMEILDIVPQTPGIDLKKPQMEYMIISVNGSVPVVVGKMQRLRIKKGDTVQVHDIVANYQRGLSVDVIGFGNQFNDMKKELVITESTRIEAKKDFYKCGSVFLDVVDSETQQGLEKIQVSETKETNVIQYKLRINGELTIVENYGRVTIRMGDTLLIEDLLAGKIDPAKYIVNFKGFVGNVRNNNGEDRGYLIDTSKDVLIKRYSLDQQGRQYHILTTLNGKEVGKLFIDIQS